MVAEDSEPLRILVVDDEANIRRLVVDVLEKYGRCSVDSAEGGREAMLLLSSNNYVCDLLITDMQMPEMTGEELLSQALERRPELGVVILTAYGNDENAIACLKKGALDYISKPIEVEKFIATITDAARYVRDRKSAPDAAVEINTPLVGWMEITAPSDMEYVERFNRFLTRLRSLPFSQRERDDLRVAISEVGKRTVEGGGGRLRMSYAVFKEQLIIMIEDEDASPTPARESEPGETRRHVTAKFRDIRRLMDEVLFSETGNIILLSKKFKTTTVF